MLEKLSVAAAFIAFGCSLFIGLDRFVHRTHFPSSPFEITTSYSSPEWEIPPSLVEDPKLIDQILNQKFTYFNKGSQAYVYLSEDKKYVLKFLKQNKLQPDTWLAHIPLSFNPHYKRALVLKRKRNRTFQAIKTAFSNFKEETGLLYAHLNRSNHLNKKITLFDRKGKLHTVNLDKTSFVIQKKASLIYVRITELMEEGDVRGAKGIISSVFSLIDCLGRRGVTDNDPILRKNFGLIDDKAVQIDIGQMQIDAIRAENLAYKSEVAIITSSFKKWVGKNYPELLPHFEAKLEKTVQQEFSLTLESH